LAYLDPTDAYQHLRDRTLEGIRYQFQTPIKGKSRSLELVKLEVDDPLRVDDIRGQQKAKMNGETWGSQVFGTLEMKDNLTGAVVDTKRIRLAEIPKTTKRYSYIVSGQEYQVDNQWQLKPGVYVRRKGNGDLEARFNVTGKVGQLNAIFDPATKLFKVEYRKSKGLPLYPFLKAMGIGDDELERTWGKEIFTANKNAPRSASAVESFYKTNTGEAAPSYQAAAQHLHEIFADAKMRPEVNEVTLGKPIESITGEALHLATKKLLDVQRGAPEDDRDNLVFKDLRSAGDFAYERLRSQKRTIVQKLQRQLNSAKIGGIREVVRFDYFNEPVKQLFTKTSIANPATQINPLQMVSTAMQTTIMGPGGIKSDRSVTDEAKLINPSHLGFLDPINTPECYDDQTEVFTFDGWKKWADVTKWDLLACRIDGRLSFHAPIELQTYAYKGKMYGVEKPWLSYLVTPNHRVLCRPYASPGASEYRVDRADQVHGRPRLFPIAHAPYLGEECDSYFHLPFVMGNNSSKNVEKISLLDWAEFMGWYLSEGCTTFVEETSTYLVRISQSYEKNKENCERIEALLDRLPFAWCHTENGYTIGVKQLAHYMKQFGFSGDKFIPEYFFKAPVRVREALLETLVLGDARKCATHKAKRQNSISYTTTSSRLAKDVEFLAISLGHATSSHRYEDHREERYLDIYEICFLIDKERSALPKKGHYRVVDYDGMVYCATVPGSFLYVRRNGKHPLWSGNSDKTGVTLRLPMGVKKKGTEATIAAYNLKTGKFDDVTPTMFLKGNIVLPDQVDWKSGKPVPIASRVKMVGEQNRIEEKSFSDADYVLRHPSQLFNVTSNLIPFLPNDSGGRAGMASRHMEQAISLVHRQAPLVQVAAPAVPGSGIDSFEQLLGHQTSHRAPAAGTVTKIKKDAIIVTGSDGHEHEVQLYNNYPLNDVKSVMHSTPLVKVGDKVTNGQIVADTNYSKNGTLALGTNLRVAYIPFKGYNFEDGIVISDSAAQKLSSVHLHKPLLKVESNTILDPKKFSVLHPGVFKPDQYDKLDEQGVVRVGQKITPGDPLILAMRPFEIKDRVGLAATRKALSAHHSDNSIRWDSDFEGEVVAVHKGPDKITVHVRTTEPMQVGDKLSGRHGNKGIVTKILSDDEMPKSKSGGPIDVLLNPSGVPGRMNVGQVLETAAAKIAQKTGKIYLVDNFDSKSTDALSRVKSELQKHGISDTEEVIDPLSHESLGQVLVGPQYMLKLVHQVEKKLSVRSGMTLPGLPSVEPYDTNLQPGGGGHAGGQSLSHLALYALLAHGAKANIREMSTWKSEGRDPQPSEIKKWPSQHIEVWKAIQEGTPLPPPKSTFAFKKFTDMLKGSGINIEKEGHQFVLGPLTDKQILSMSSGELTQADKSPVRAKTDKAGEFVVMPGGLFDEKITGGHGGTKWAHLRLAEPVPNPIFEGAIKKLTGLKEKQFASIMMGDAGVEPGTGRLTTPKQGITGGAGIKALLDRIDVSKDLASAKQELQKTPLSKADKVLKRVKYLTSLQKLEMKPSEAYMLHNIPIVPPVIRPLTMMADGGLKYEDINGLYKQFETINNRLKDPILSANLTDRKKRELRDAYYDGVKAIMGVGTVNKDKKEKGLLDQISPEGSPKEGYFQSVLTNRRQDLTMRSTIVPEPSLGLDEVGLPRDAALTLFRPFVIRQLVLQGAAPTALQATAVLAKVHKGQDNPMVWRALEHVMNERPVLLKRDPSLHKYSVQAFKPRIVMGNAIQIHPLVTGGFNADFDGDTMAVYVPISHEAVREAQKMFPSNNIFNEASGHVMYQPTLESALGLYKLSMVGKKTDAQFKTSEEVVEALHQGKTHYTDVVSLDGRSTTPGRVLLASVLPSSLHKQVLHDMDFRVDKDGLKSILTQVGKRNAGEFGRIADDVKNLGYDAAYGVVNTSLAKGGHVAIGTHSLSLDDFTTDKGIRDPILKDAREKVKDIHDSTRLSSSEKDRQSVGVWVDASDKMMKVHRQKAEENPSNLYLMARAGVKPSWDQYKQMVLAPMIYKDSFDRDIPMAVTKSYGEGLDLGGYWTQLYGARRGAVMKVQEVQEPGALSKLLLNTTMNMLVEKPDCGTKKGISLAASDSDTHDRFLAQGFHAGHLHIPEGTLLTPDIMGQIRSADKNAKILVRSPLKCEAEHGLCQKCVGPSVEGQAYDLGTNIGVISAQAVGERAMQLMLKGFHTGGVRESGGGSKVVNQFDRFNQLTRLPAKIPNAATVAMASGRVERIVPTETGVDIWVNGTKHFVGRDPSGSPLHTAMSGANRDSRYIQWKAPEVGDQIEAGHILSDPNRTSINPHDLYRATGNIDAVQNQITGEMDRIYEGSVRRRMLETLVKAMSNLTKIEDPGDHQHLLRGEFHPTSVVKRLNETELKGKMPILHKPVLQGVDVLPLSLQEDWMAKMQHNHLKNTLYEAAAQGLASNIHGASPIPGVAYGAEFGLPPRNAPAHHY
jgi:DNA-directed RNA polymerase subunit beta'